MKIIWSFCGLLAAFVSILATQTQEKPYDIIVRDDKEPFLASIQSKIGAYAVQSCDEYGFGSVRDETQNIDLMNLIDTT